MDLFDITILHEGANDSSSGNESSDGSNGAPPFYHHARVLHRELPKDVHPVILAHPALHGRK